MPLAFAALLPPAAVPCQGRGLATPDEIAKDANQKEQYQNGHDQPLAVCGRRLKHHALNRAYRDKDKPTNVLSFPMVQDDLLEVTANTDDGEVLLGDIVLAEGVCAAEAADKGISVADHATHLIVHGTFHLLGYDHMDDNEAEAMEALEITALASLGLADPYGDREEI